MITRCRDEIIEQIEDIKPLLNDPLKGVNTYNTLNAFYFGIMAGMLAEIADRLEGIEEALNGEKRSN